MSTVKVFFRYGAESVEVRVSGDHGGEVVHGPLETTSVHRFDTPELAWQYLRILERHRIPLDTWAAAEVAVAGAYGEMAIADAEAIEQRTRWEGVCAERGYSDPDLKVTSIEVEAPAESAAAAAPDPR